MEKLGIIKDNHKRHRGEAENGRGVETIHRDVPGESDRDQTKKDKEVGIGLLDAASWWMSVRTPSA